MEELVSRVGVLKDEKIDEPAINRGQPSAFLSRFILDNCPRFSIQRLGKGVFVQTRFARIVSSHSAVAASNLKKSSYKKPSTDFDADVVIC